MTLAFTSIEQIQAHEFCGNHFSDSAAFDAIFEFVLNTSVSVADRAEAIRVMQGKGMGCGRSENVTDDDLVNEFLQES